MAIYTKTGDRGETSLANGQRVSKTDARLEAYGTVDELNSWVGALRSAIENYELRITNDELQWVQNKLFNLGASLSEAEGEWITEDDVHQLEQWIDAMQAETPKQRAFVLPCGGEAVARCHICRTVCRRAERRMLTAHQERPIDEKAFRFVNRLSDYMFVLARYIGYKSGEKEQVWQK